MAMLCNTKRKQIRIIQLLTLDDVSLGEPLMKAIGVVWWTGSWRPVQRVLCIRGRSKITQRPGGRGVSGSATRCYEGERGRCSGICYVTNHLWVKTLFLLKNCKKRPPNRWMIRGEGFQWMLRNFEGGVKKSVMRCYRREEGGGSSVEKSVA